MKSRQLVILVAVPALALGADHGIFQTSDRCIACHNGLVTPAGQDVSIASSWRASIMANSARDPYWQASVRREVTDHPRADATIQDECSTCHMPLMRYEARQRGESGRIFPHLPLTGSSRAAKEAADGVSCSLCHQIAGRNLGAAASFNGGFEIAAPALPSRHTEYGPFAIDPALMRIMQSSTAGFEPHQGAHIRASELCATCHTLYTRALDKRGQPIATLPEQMPYQEWLHSSFANTQSCQSCHMPAVGVPVRISRVLGEPRSGVAQHTFVAANFLMQQMLNDHRDELAVIAPADELAAAANATRSFLESKSATLDISVARSTTDTLDVDVHVTNLGGHKLPTAYPSRRAWLHVRVTAADGHVVFESGALRADGSIEGNDNDVDPFTFEPHYSAIDRADQVQIYEAIAGDAKGVVTTGLLSAVGYLKDNRLLPHGFDKRTAPAEIAVRGNASSDSGFTADGDTVRYTIAARNADRPLRIDAELMYQPIGFRWAANLKAYDAVETRRFGRYYDARAAGSAATLAHATVSIASDPH